MSKMDLISIFEYCVKIFLSIKNKIEILNKNIIIVVIINLIENENISLDANDVT